jgi:hypothetical protein
MTNMANIMAKDMANQSRIDPSRKTVGAIYRDIAIQNKEQYVVNGDLTHELMNSLVDDLNETVASDPFEGKPFYVTIYEKKDLQMPRAILRRLYVSKYRPYPEDDTLVFYVEPKTNKIKFCWCLPHVSLMDNMLMNFTLYNKDMIEDIRAWKKLNLSHFGFEYIGNRLVPKKDQEKDKLINFPELSFSFHQ